MTIRSKSFLTSSLVAAALSSALIVFLGFPATPVKGSSFVFPIVAPKLSSKFGKRNHPVWKVTRHHEGIDLAVPDHSPIRAVASGVVVFADPYAGYGNLVVIRHSEKITTHYGHCSEIKVKPGQKVSAGEIIATVGSTGTATGSHLHFEIRQDGESLDPLKLIPGLTSAAEG